jgi:hypothetical protein
LTWSGKALQSRLGQLYAQKARFRLFRYLSREHRMKISTPRAFVLALILTVLVPPAQTSSAADSAKPDVVVVYWSSKDCKWCNWWESGVSGMERSFKESDEFKLITYRVVKNDRLADPYTPENFPSDIQWVYELYKNGEKHSGRPGWAVYVDRKRVATFYGTKQWTEKNLPGLKRVIAQYAAK